MKNIKDIKLQVLKECKDKHNGKTLCNEKFFTIEQEGNEMVIKDCECRKILDTRIKCLFANINEDFWKFKWDNIENDFSDLILQQLDYFRNNVETCVDNDIQFFFHGKVGTGKTLIASLMLKDVLDKGYQGYLVKSYELIRYLYSKKDEENDKLQEIREADFLVIDEIDKLNGRQSVINDFCAEVVSYIDSKPLIFISNDDFKKLKNNNYPDYFIDRLKSMKEIVINGSNYRNELGSKYDNLK